MLFSCLKGHNEAIVTVAVFGSANDATGHFADVFHSRRHKAEVWPAERHRHTQALAFACYDIGAHRAGCFQDSERYGIAGHDKKSTFFVCGFGDVTEIIDAAEEIGVLQNHSGGVIIQFG